MRKSTLALAFASITLCTRHLGRPGGGLRRRDRAVDFYVDGVL